MSYLQQFTIRARLLFTALLASMALLVVGLTGGLSIRDCVAALEDLSAGELRDQAHLVHLRKHMGDLRRFEKDALLNIGDIDLSRSYQQRWQAALQAARAELDALQTSQGRQAAQLARASLDRYAVGAAEVIQRLGPVNTIATIRRSVRSG